jgi:general secretion pathway protein N
VRALRPYVLVAVLVFAGVMLATLPAGLVTRALPSRLALDGVSGTVWDGAAERMQLDGVALGRLTWRLAPTGWWHGTLAAEVALTRPDGFLRGRLQWHANGDLDGDDVELDLPLTTLHPEHAQATWDGRVAGTVRHVHLVQGWPVALDAALSITHLHAPNDAADWGTYALTFDAREADATAVLGRLHEVDGPLKVQAQLRLERTQTYRLDGDVAPRGPIEESLARALAFLGPAEPDGRRTLTVTGSF